MMEKTMENNFVQMVSSGSIDHAGMLYLVKDWSKGAIKKLLDDMVVKAVVILMDGGNTPGNQVKSNRLSDMVDFLATELLPSYDKLRIPTQTAKEDETMPHALKERFVFNTLERITDKEQVIADWDIYNNWIDNELGTNPTPADQRAALEILSRVGAKLRPHEPVIKLATDFIIELHRDGIKSYQLENAEKTLNILSCFLDEYYLRQHSLEAITKHPKTPKAASRVMPETKAADKLKELESIRQALIKGGIVTDEGFIGQPSEFKVLVECLAELGVSNGKTKDGDKKLAWDECIIWVNFKGNKDSARSSRKNETNTYITKRIKAICKIDS